MMVRVLCLAALALVLAGCGSGVRFVRTDATLYAPKPKDAPVAVREGGTSEPYAVIGTLTTRKKMKASFNDSSIYDEALAKLKAAAREIGADALIETEPRVLGEGMGGQVEISAVAVRYLTRVSTVTTGEQMTGASN